MDITDLENVISNSYKGAYSLAFSTDTTRVDIKIPMDMLINNRDDILAAWTQLAEDITDRLKDAGY